MRIRIVRLCRLRELFNDPSTRSSFLPALASPTRGVRSRTSIRRSPPTAPRRASRAMASSLPSRTDSPTATSWRSCLPLGADSGDACFASLSNRSSSRCSTESPARRDGGVVTFLGIVRDDSGDGRRVHALWIRSLRVDGAARVRDHRVRGARPFRRGAASAIVHRVGEVRAGEISVAVLAAAPHRAAAFDACRYAIDELKRRAPIWKKECYADGSAQWRSGA